MVPITLFTLILLLVAKTLRDDICKRNFQFRSSAIRVGDLDVDVEYVISNRGHWTVPTLDNLSTT